MKEQYQQINGQVIRALMRQADRDFQEWNHPLPVNYGDHDRELPVILRNLPHLDGKGLDQWITEISAARPGAHVLEIGCGTGRALATIQQQYGNTICYGITGSTFYEFHNPSASAMRLAENSLILGNAAHLKELMQKALPGMKFDVIFSFQTFYCIPLPFLYLIQQIYDLLEVGGVAFLDHREDDYNKVVGLDELEQWLSSNGYVFEFIRNPYTERNTPPSTHIDFCAFRRTHDLVFPVAYTYNCESVFMES